MKTANQYKELAVKAANAIARIMKENTYELHRILCEHNTTITDIDTWNDGTDTAAAIRFSNGYNYLLHRQDDGRVEISGKAPNTYYKITINMFCKEHKNMMIDATW